jgi:hypothetical protein
MRSETPRLLRDNSKRTPNRSFPPIRLPLSFSSFPPTPTMNFAPYQDESPEVERAFSPSLGDPHRVKSPNLRSPRASPPIASNGLPSPSHFAPSGHVPTSGHGNTGFGRDVEGGRWNLGAFETSLPIRMDFEAMLAYLLLPPAGGVFLLLVEHKSDYVRYVERYGIREYDRRSCLADVL